MSVEDSLEARQNNELEALQAIYGGDLRDLRTKAAWNKWTPLNLSISLTPQQGSSGFQEIYACLDLHVICNEKYPNSIPIIHIENSKGLSNTILSELFTKLEEKAEGLKGEEMIFQLCQFVEEFLHQHNKPSSKSFYDEMLERQKEQEEKEMLAKQIEWDRQRQYMIEEVQRRQEILKSEVKKRRETRQNSDNDDESNNTHRCSFSNSTESSDESLCQHKGSEVIEFGSRTIHRGRCIKHSSSNHVIFSGIDKESGELVIITEWNITIPNRNDLSNVQRQISSIEQEINYLTKLKHNSLSHYISFKYNIDETTIIIFLLSEFIHGSNCSSLFIMQNLKVDVDLLKYIAKGVLISLDYLHRNNVVHKDLRESCVYLCDAGNIKLSNYSIHRRISDFISHAHNNYGKKTDIFKFGMLMLSLIKGNAITENNLDIPDSLPSDLLDLLSRCIAKEESDRYTTSQLLNHSFFRKPIIHFSPKHTNVEIEMDRNISPESVANDLKLLSQCAPGQSRINSEFEFLQHLGKGAFGDVIKVRNKLDGGYYAIKRIKLNPKNKALNKKIVREVKLLSRLNHENVVRYYNSWIETTTIKEDINFDTGTSTEEKRPMVIRKEEFTLNDNIEALAPPIKNIEVSIIYDSKSQATFEDSSDDDSSDDEDNWGVVYHDDSDSDGIEFEHNSESISTQTVSSLKDTNPRESPQEIVKQIDFMYIQMEFCEKSTLRTAIDNNLCLDEDRLWRLFREIVEGLAHIHQQGMIHRDLKPVNIFLDSEDHVKIGDFGLATTSIKSKQNEYNLSKSAVENEKEETADESKTGLVGTALYVAPEISVSSKVVYNQKVDIYSLGIILFEMCYKPLDTSMERIKILTKLRLGEIAFPEDFINKKNDKSIFLIKWLLNHDISKRPTSLELLQSEHVPPPVLEECELRELVRHTLSNPQMKGYKYLIASCFKQSVTAAQDITYDKDPSAQNIARPLQLYEFVRQTCEKIFKQHGGQNLTTPLLMPKSKFYEDIESCVNLMTHFGSIVSLPHDLRVSFARYIAWNGITLLRRYSIERVYREKKVFGFQPRELYECAFDIVSPTQGGLMSDAEILYIVYEIINELPGIKNKNFIIRLNHTSLLKAILLHCGIKDKHQEVYNMVSVYNEGKTSKLQMQSNFITLGLPDNSINMLLNFFYSEFEISKALNHFQMITKKKQSEASHLARQALQELKIISQHAEVYGVTFDIVVSPGLVYNAQHYSGMICQFVCEMKKKHKHKNMEVVAAGGRYDSLIAWYRTIMEQANMLGRGVQQSAVGISLSLDRLVQALQKEPNEDLPKMQSVDVVVCSVGSKQMLKEKTKILRNLWAAGIRSLLIESINIEEIQEQLAELKATHVIMLKDNEQGTVRIQSWDRDRVQEKCFNSTELIENMQRILKNWNENSIQENSSLSVLSRSESKTNYSEKNDYCQDVDVLFVTEEKISSNARKRYENQARSHLDGLFKKLTGHVMVVGLSVESNVIKTLASFLEFETEYQFQKSVESVIERHSRHKKYINNICDEIYNQRISRKNPTLVLYSLSDYCYKVIL